MKINMDEETNIVNSDYSFRFTIYLMTLTAIISILAFALLVCPVNATESSLNVSTGGNAGALIVHSDFSSTSSGNDIGFITGNENYNEMTSGAQIVTIGGGTSYTGKLASNSQYKNALIVKNEVNYDDQAAISNTYSMMDNKAYVPEVICDAGDVPNPSETSANGFKIEGQNPSYQYVDVQYEGTTSNGGRFKSGAAINDANITTSMRAEGNSGGISANYMASSEAGFDQSTNAVNFEKKYNSHTSWYGTNDSGYYAPSDMEWKDHSTPFETIPMPKVNLSTNNTTINVTEDSNVTETNEVIDELFINITP